MTAPLPAARRLELLDRMIRIREFEEGVRFLFLEGAMPGTIHQCQGQEATAVGVCAALRQDDFITSTFRGHGHAIAKGLTEQELLDELFGAATGCCKGKGGSMHVGEHEQGHGSRHRHRRRRHSARGGHGAGVQDAEERPGRRLLLRRRRGGRGRVPRGREHGGDLAAAGDLRLREQSLRRLDPHRSRDEEPARRRSRRLLRHRRRDGRTATTSRPSSPRPSARRRAAAPATGRSCSSSSPTARPATRGATRASTSRRRSGRNGRRAIRSRASPPASRRRASPTQARVERMRSRAAQRFAEAVERARAAPQPSLDDLETDVFAAEAAP